MTMIDNSFLSATDDNQMAVDDKKTDTLEEQEPASNPLQDHDHEKTACVEKIDASDAPFAVKDVRLKSGGITPSKRRVGLPSERMCNLPVPQSVKEQDAKKVLGRSGMVTDYVLVPAKMVGIVIGKSGVSIKSINQASSAHIVLDKKNPPDSRERRFIIRGLQDCVNHAKLMVLEKIGLMQNIHTGTKAGQEIPPTDTREVAVFQSVKTIQSVNQARGPHTVVVEENAPDAKEIDMLEKIKDLQTELKIKTEKIISLEKTVLSLQAKSVSITQIKLSSILGLTWKREHATGSNYVLCVSGFLKSISNSLECVFMKDDSVFIRLKDAEVLRRAFADHVSDAYNDKKIENLTPRMKIIPGDRFDTYNLDIFIDEENTKLQSPQALVYELSRTGTVRKRRDIKITASFTSLVAYVRALTNFKFVKYHKLVPHKSNFQPN